MTYGLFIPLFLTGVERIEAIPGTHGGYGDGIIYADYTHSFLGALVLPLAFGVLAGKMWERRAGMLHGTVIFSHWILDLPMHHHDTPWLPMNLGKFSRTHPRAHGRFA